MPYNIDTIYAPYKMEDGQDMWVGTISSSKHEHQIEVRNVTEAGLNILMVRIVKMLNSNILPTSEPTLSPDESWDRSMKGI